MQGLPVATTSSCSSVFLCLLLLPPTERPSSVFSVPCPFSILLSNWSCFASLDSAKCVWSSQKASFGTDSQGTQNQRASVCQARIVPAQHTSVQHSFVGYGFREGRWSWLDAVLGTARSNSTFKISSRSAPQVHKLAYGHDAIILKTISIRCQALHVAPPGIYLRIQLKQRVPATHATRWCYTDGDTSTLTQPLGPLHAGQQSACQKHTVPLAAMQT